MASLWVGHKVQFGSGVVSSSRGSTLILAVIFSATLVVVLTSLMDRILTEQRSARRGITQSSLFYVAEGYLDKAIWCVNNSEWDGWETFRSGSDRYHPFTEVRLGNYTVWVHALVINAEDSPTIYSEAVTDPDHYSNQSRQLRVKYETRYDNTGTSGSGIPGGLISKGTIDLGGQPIIDSYDSRLGPWDPFSNRSDLVTVGTVSSASDAFKVSGQVDLYGYAGTGREDPVIDISGPQNRIYGEDTPPGTNIDWNRVYGDFTFDFPLIQQPDWSGATRSIEKADNKTVSLGTPGLLTKYKTDKLELSGGKKSKYKIVGPVQMYLTDGVSISGQAHIEIADGGSLEIYTPKDVTISGQGVVNKTSVSGNMVFYGTANKEKDQTLSLSGQGTIEMVVYAPNAVINMSGQGDLCGSVVGYEVKQSGQGNFHYDISLGGSDTSQGEGDLMTMGDVSAWHETTSVVYSFDIESYVKEYGGTYYIPL